MKGVLVIDFLNLNQKRCLIKQILVVLFLILFYTSCVEETPKTCFEKIKKSFEREEILNYIKVYPQDSLPYVYPFFLRACEQFQKEMDCQKEIEDWLDTNLIPTDRTLRDRIIILAFQKYLNNKEIDLEEIQFEIREERKRIAEEEKLLEQRLLNNIYLNDSLWTKGDTLDIFLQVDDHGKSKSVFYSADPYSSFSMADDTVKVKGVLVDKFYKIYSKEEPDLKHPLSLYFKLKVLEVSDTATYEVSQKIEVGKEFDLNLGLYGRLID